MFVVDVKNCFVRETMIPNYQLYVCKSKILGRSDSKISFVVQEIKNVEEEVKSQNCYIVSEKLRC